MDKSGMDGTDETKQTKTHTKSHALTFETEISSS